MIFERAFFYTIFISAFFFHSCKNLPEDNSINEPTYKLVKKVEIKDSFRAEIEAFGSKKSIIIDFNQLPGDSLYGVEVYDLMGNLIWEKKDRSYYVHSNLEEEKFILTNFTPGGREPTDKGFPGEYTHQVFDTAGKVIAEAEFVRGIQLTNSNGFDFFSLRYQFVHLINVKNSNEIKISGDQIRARNIQTQFFGKDSVIIVGGQLDSYFEGEEDIRNDSIVSELKVKHHKIREELLEIDNNMHKGIDDSIELIKQRNLLLEKVQYLGDQIRNIRSKINQQNIKWKYRLEAYLYSINENKITDTLTFRNEHPWYRTMDFGYNEKIKVNEKGNTIGIQYSVTNGNAEREFPFMGLLIISKKGEVKYDYTNHSVINFEFISDSQLLIQGSDKNQKRWLLLVDLISGRELWKIPSHERSAFKSLGIKDGKIALAFRNRIGFSIPFIVDLNTGKMEVDSTISAGEELITQFGSDNRVLYNRYSKTLYFYKLEY